MQCPNFHKIAVLASIFSATAILISWTVGRHIQAPDFVSFLRLHDCEDEVCSEEHVVGNRGSLSASVYSVSSVGIKVQKVPNCMKIAV